MRNIDYFKQLVNNDNWGYLSHFLVDELFCERINGWNKEEIQENFEYWAEQEFIPTEDSLQNPLPTDIQ